MSALGSFDFAKPLGAERAVLGESGDEGECGFAAHAVPPPSDGENEPCNLLGTGHLQPPD